MKPGLRHDVNLGQKVKQAQNIELGKALAASRLAEEEEGEDGRQPEGEEPEPPALEDLADSDRFLEDSPPGSAFDRAWNEPVPLISQLPRRLRPPVRCRIDSNLDVHLLAGEAPKTEALERAITEAIVEHLRNTGVELRAPGDWCAVPCIGSDRELADLVPEHLRTALDEARLHSIGNIVKDFAIQLPSGDVVTPQALLDRARKGKRTTRAAALRWASQRPESTPDGEQWTADDWNGFEDTQRKKKYSKTARLGTRTSP